MNGTSGPPFSFSNPPAWSSIRELYHGMNWAWVRHAHKCSTRQQSRNLWLSIFRMTSNGSATIVSTLKITHPITTSRRFMSLTPRRWRRLAMRGHQNWHKSSINIRLCSPCQRCSWPHHQALGLRNSPAPHLIWCPTSSLLCFPAWLMPIGLHDGLDCWQDRYMRQSLVAWYLYNKSPTSATKTSRLADLLDIVILNVYHIVKFHYCSPMQHLPPCRVISQWSPIQSSTLHS